MKTPKRRWHKVGVRKEYFPRELWPKEFGRAYVETFVVLATGRADAAQKIWALHGKRLLALMTPDTSIHGRKISLEVNWPGRGSIGRCAPVLVEQLSPRPGDGVKKD